jgi:hypothetical protein
VRHAEERRLQLLAIAARGDNPYDADTASFRFLGVYPEISFSVLLEGNEADYLLRAAKLVYATLQFRRALLCDEIDKERHGDVIFDNSRYHHLFGRVVDIDRCGGRWNKQVRDVGNSRHIVVVVRGRFYPIQVLAENGEIIDLAELRSRLIAVVSRARDPNYVPFSVLTAAVTRDTIELFNNCRSDPSIRIVDEALFVLAIDVDDYCKDDNEAANAIHIGGYRNRDYRKSLQLVVLASGRAGIVCNLFAGVEGVIATRFASWIALHEQILPEVGNGDPSETIDPLEFQGMRNLPYGSIVDILERKICKLICELPLIQRIDTIGKDRIKDLHVSPDGFFHAALHWSFNERFRRLPAVHNFADMRAVRYGSAIRYLSTTPQVAKFVAKPSRATLLQAAEAHRRRAVAVKSGNHPFHFVFFYYRNGSRTRALIALALMYIFVPDFIAKHRSPDVLASNVPGLPGIVCLGRFGVYFRYAGSNSLAGHYMLFPDHITICFTSNNCRILDSWQIHTSLSSAMTKMEELLLE